MADKNKGRLEICGCGSGKPFKECCFEKIEAVRRKQQSGTEESTYGRYTADRGYRNWADLMEAERQSKSGINDLGSRILKPIDDFFGFWKDQILALVRYFKNKRDKGKQNK